MNVALISFTDRGADVAARVAEALRAEGHEASCACGSGPGKVDRMAWAAEEFARCDALVFIGAAGIAVRTVAPLLESKLSDPAILVIDEACEHCVPLLSGHVGGANELARRIGALVGAEPVITTATDVAGVFAVDTWAVSHGLSIVHPERIKMVSGALLAGREVTCSSEQPIAGCAPDGLHILPARAREGIDIQIGIECVPADVLGLVPRKAVLGVGCRRGAEAAHLSAAVDAFLASHGIEPVAIGMLASIDLKASEPGLLELAGERGWAFRTFSADELNSQGGDFEPSSFVRDVTGTDNVCERSVAATGAAVLFPKETVEGVALALGVLPFDLAW